MRPTLLHLANRSTREQNMRDCKNWLSMHIHVDDEATMDRLITSAFTEVTEALRYRGWTGKAFFIRYSEQGPHLRLRLSESHALPPDEMEHTVRSVLGAILERGPASTLPNRRPHWRENNTVHRIPYVPEYLR